jgi:hypothetical protein
MCHRFQLVQRPEGGVIRHRLVHVQLKGGELIQVEPQQLLTIWSYK